MLLIKFIIHESSYELFYLSTLPLNATKLSFLGWYVGRKVKSFELRVNILYFQY